MRILEKKDWAKAIWKPSRANTNSCSTIFNFLLALTGLGRSTSLPSQSYSDSLFVGLWDICGIYQHHSFLWQMPHIPVICSILESPLQHGLHPQSFMHYLISDCILTDL